ncbi:hypothetical protein J6TS2_02100 [Heyndrickxia sporothermodurans]|nr:hypothetical protein J6TS2_02100 [Heyndrickxia sporothermodurans]
MKNFYKFFSNQLVVQYKYKINKKPCSNLQGPSISYVKGQKAKGEEKPEEELMGKRKSSPRLATTSENDVAN